MYENQNECNNIPLINEIKEVNVLSISRRLFTHIGLFQRGLAIFDVIFFRSSIFWQVVRTRMPTERMF